MAYSGEILPLFVLIINLTGGKFLHIAPSSTYAINAAVFCFVFFVRRTLFKYLGSLINFSLSQSENGGQSDT